MKNIRFLLISALAVILLLGGCAMDTKDSKTISSSSPNTTIEDENQGAMPYERISFSSDSIEDFIAWIESDGTKEVGMNGELEYPANRQFIELMKGRNDIIIPVMKNEAYRLRSVVIAPEANQYAVSYYAYDASKVPENMRTFGVSITILSETEKGQRLDSLSEALLHESVRSNSGKAKTVLVEEKSPWGEYCVAKESERGVPAVSFRNSEFFIQIYIHNSIEKIAMWSNEYFDYIDFETVSLK